MQSGNFRARSHTDGFATSRAAPQTQQNYFGNNNALASTSNGFSGFGAGEGGSGRSMGGAKGGGSKAKKMCDNWVKDGQCKFGASCYFSHGEDGGAKSRRGNGNLLGPILPFNKEYNAAALLPYRRDQSGNIYFLLSLDFRKDKSRGENSPACNYVGFLGGQKKDGDPDFVMTAIREFWEKSGKVVPDSHLQPMYLSVIQNTGMEHQCVYVERGKFYLIFYHLSHDLDIVEKYCQVNQSAKANNGRYMPKMLFWSSLKNLYQTSGAGLGHVLPTDATYGECKVYSLVTNTLVTDQCIEYLSKISNESGLVTSAEESNSESLAKKFCESFYQWYHSNDYSFFATLITEDSLLSCENEKVKGRMAIVSKLQSLYLKKLQFEPLSLSCQDSLLGGFVILVMGFIKYLDNPSMAPTKFCQCFTLISNNQGSYIVTNIILRAPQL